MPLDMSLDTSLERTDAEWMPLPPGEVIRTRTHREPEATGGAGRRKNGRLGRDAHRWSRLIHVYTSMIALLVVLFFAVTGITLNHPEWTFGDEVETETISGDFPFETTLPAGDGSDASVDFLTISEYVRDTYDVSGSVDSFSVANGEGSIAYKNPGYSANVFFDVETGAFDLTVEQQGWVAVMNDMHKGRDTGSAWKWTIDIAAGFLVAISLTGLVMQFFLRKRRRSALITAGVGSVVTVVLIALALA